jgi:Zn-dependent protease
MGASPHNYAGLRLTRADQLAIAVGLLALLGGVATLVLSPGFTAAVIGACLIGVSCVAFVTFAFLLVGEREDRSYGKHTR